MENLCNRSIFLGINKGHSEEDFLFVFVKDEIYGKKNLLEFFRGVLNMPGYFGDNWDAFEECMFDLSWIKQKFIFIIHLKFPDIKDNEIKIYQDILASASNYHAKNNEHELLVIYPRDL